MAELKPCPFCGHKAVVEGCGSNVDGELETDVTHYMPLPEPPVEQMSGGSERGKA